MTEKSPQREPGHESHEEYEEDEINLLDLFLVLLKHKKLIFWLTFAAGVLSIIYSLMLTPKYIATARVLPPISSGTIPQGLVSNVAEGPFRDLASSLIDVDPPSALYVGILQSRTVADGIIEKFNLKEYYKTNTMSATHGILQSASRFNSDRKNDIVSISVEDKDPKIAAEMANYYVAMLDSVTRKVNITEGQRKRVFIEERLKKVESDLKAAENLLKEFQEKYKLVSITQQAEVAIEGAAKLKGEIILAETELEVLKQFGTERQNEAIFLKSKIEELEKQLAKIERGNQFSSHTSKNNDSSYQENSNFYIPFDEIPALGLQLARLIREAKIQEKVFELMTTHYEIAKLEEAKDINTIQVLDEAIPPDSRSRPKRKKIVVLSVFVTFFFSIFFVFLIEFVEKIKTEDAERFEQVKNHLTFRKNNKLKKFVSSIKKSFNSG